MSVLGAMRAGVSGLQAQSMKFGALADNISNSSTIGYKRADVHFSTMVTEAASGAEYTSGGMRPAVGVAVSSAGRDGTSDGITAILFGGGPLVVIPNHLGVGVPPTHAVLLVVSFAIDK